MLALPQVALLAVDTVHPHLALSAMRHSMEWVDFASAHLLTDMRRNGNLTKLVPRGVSVEHHKQSDAFRMFPGFTRRFYLDYELAVLTQPNALLNRLPETVTHVLYTEWDASVLNPRAWRRSWLQYDFIGAPWPRHSVPGWPACDGRTNAVGNTGFSLMSRAFCREIAKLAAESGDVRRYASDMWACRTMRPTLEALGIRFAPVHVAEAFSCENRVYAGSFGFHGVSTAKINNWGEWLVLRK